MLNTELFGSKIRAIREELNYTRLQVDQLTGVNKETLRKIEKGDVVPKLTTLQLLSAEYRIDLIKLFNTYKDNNILLNTNNLIDNIMMNHADSTDSLDAYKILDKDIKSYNLIDPIEIEQFNSFLTYLPMSQYPDKDKKKAAIDGLIKAVSIRHVHFTIENMTKFSYSYIELRILFLIGVVYAELKDPKLSNYIFSTVHEHLEIDEYSSSKSKQLYIKLLINIAYNQHSLNNPSKVLEVAEHGISICNTYNSSYLLEALLYRKAVALHELKKPEALNTFKQVRAILEIKGYDQQLELYSKITLDKYNIEL